MIICPAGAGRDALESPEVHCGILKPPKTPSPGCIRKTTFNMSKKKLPDNTIARNKKAWHEYFIEEEFEAGLMLQGWEVKSCRAGRVQLKESYVMAIKGELFLIGAHISPLASASTHVRTDPTRSRKLLLNRHEISKLIGAVERKGYAIVALSMYWKHGRAKLKIGLARGKKQHDKRATIKEREWQREQHRVLKANR